MWRYYFNKDGRRSTATFIMAVLIVILLLVNVRGKYENELRVKTLESKVLSLDEELLLAQNEILEYLERADLQVTLDMFNESREDLFILVERIDILTDKIGD